MKDSVAIRNVVMWAALECDRQRSNELSVARMVFAWEYAYSRFKNSDDHERWPTEYDVRWLGYLIEPTLNADGFRTVRIWVGRNEKLDPILVPEAMHGLMQSYGNFTPDEAFLQFEDIHPFRDGNGRTGNVLWNWIRGSLSPTKLEFPPDYWGIDTRGIKQFRKGGFESISAPEYELIR